METNIKNIIELWKKNGIIEAQMEFTCGGDSMGDTFWKFFKDKEDLVGGDINEIEDYLNNEVYNRVEFYEVSDGEYMGESGNVYVRLNDDEDDFYYLKSSSAEYQRYVTGEIIVELPDYLKQFVEEYISSFNGEDFSVDYTYKKDLILTDTLIELQNELSVLLNNKAEEAEIDSEGDMNDMYLRFHSDQIESGKINLYVERQFYVWEDSKN